MGEITGRMDHGAEGKRRDRVGLEELPDRHAREREMLIDSLLRFRPLDPIRDSQPRSKAVVASEEQQPPTPRGGEG